MRSPFGPRKRRRPNYAQARLTDLHVREIRQRLAAGEKQRSIAADFGITQAMVSYIKNELRWKEI